MVGLVLAGGRSVRFGGEKAVALLEGRPLLEWAAQRLRTVCANVAINVRPGTEAEAVAKALGLPTLYDAAGDASGPLAGVKAGLIWAEGQGAQHARREPVRRAALARRSLRSPARARRRWGGDGRNQRRPPAAVRLWPVAALPAVREALAGGAHPPTWQMLERLGARKVLFEPPEAFANINTRDDLAAVEAERSRPA